jgi:hypothetical protein
MASLARVTAYKAHWVAKGYAQIKWLHFNDIHASVVPKDSIQVFLFSLISLDMECDQVDTKAAILNGELEETIFMEPPEGSDISQGKVIWLRKSLYGLHQSPRCFNQSSSKWLKSESFTPTRTVPCLYVYKLDKDTMLVSIHDDDQLIACNDRSALNALKERLNAQFECTDNGPVNPLLGFNVIRGRQARWLDISQQH